MKASCSESSSDVTTCSDATSVIVHSKTPLHRRVQALVFWWAVFSHSHILSNNTKCCQSARFSCASFIRRLSWRSFSHHHKRHKVTYQHLVVVSSEMFSPFVAPSSKPVEIKVYSYNVTHKQIPRHIASVPMQHHMIETDNEL